MEGTNVYDNGLLSVIKMLNDIFFGSYVELHLIAIIMVEKH